jgi:hypothetical protein
LALEPDIKDGDPVMPKVLLGWELPKNMQPAVQPGERGRGLAEVRPRFICCTPLLGSIDRVGTWMIILVPGDGENDHRGYGRNEHEMVDDTGEERRNLEYILKIESSRRSQSIDGDLDAGFGLKGDERSGTVMRGRGDSGAQLYAEYLRSSSSTGEFRRGWLVAGKQVVQWKDEMHNI